MDAHWANDANWSLGKAPHFVTVTGVNISGGTATVSTSPVPHGFANGGMVVFYGANPWQGHSPALTIAVVDSYTFTCQSTYPSVGCNVCSADKIVFTGTVSPVDGPTSWLVITGCYAGSEAANSNLNLPSATTAYLYVLGGAGYDLELFPASGFTHTWSGRTENDSASAQRWLGGAGQINIDGGKIISGNLRITGKVQAQNCQILATLWVFGSLNAQNTVFDYDNGFFIYGSLNIDLTTCTLDDGVPISMMGRGASYNGLSDANGSNSPLVASYPPQSLTGVVGDGAR